MSATKKKRSKSSNGTSGLAQGDSMIGRPRPRRHAGQVGVRRDDGERPDRRYQVEHPVVRPVRAVADGLRRSVIPPPGADVEDRDARPSDPQRESRMKRLVIDDLRQASPSGPRSCLTRRIGDPAMRRLMTGSRSATSAGPRCVVSGYGRRGVLTGRGGGLVAWFPAL